MKHRRILAIVLLATLLVGCSPSTRIQDITPQTVSSTSEKPKEKITKPQDKSLEGKANDDAAINASVESAYIDFLNNQRPLIIDKAHVPDEADQIEDDLYYGFHYGEYSYEELKATIADLEMTEADVKYALVDFGHDGVGELVARFESVDPSYLSQTLVIKYIDDKLYLTHAYSDGYRSYGKLYTSGLLETGGSMGAGASVRLVQEIDGEGKAHVLFKEYIYFGTFADSIVYELTDANEPLQWILSEQAPESELCVRVYIEGDGDELKIVADDWHGDSVVKAKEEAFVDELVDLGAVLVSQETMDALTFLPTDQLEEVTWVEWESAPDSDRADSLAGDPFEYLYIDVASPEFLTHKEEYIECVVDDGEYQIPVFLQTEIPLTDVSIYRLTMDHVDESGTAIFHGETECNLPELNIQKSLVIRMTMVGTVPNVGIGYSLGEQRYTYGIAMSGMDGSLYLEEIILE